MPEGNPRSDDLGRLLAAIFPADSPDTGMYEHHGQTHFTQTVRVLLHRSCSDTLIHCDALAPAVGRVCFTVKPEPAFGAHLIHDPFNCVWELKLCQG